MIFFVYLSNFRKASDLLLPYFYQLSHGNKQIQKKKESLSLNGEQRNWFEIGQKCEAVMQGIYFPSWKGS